MNLFQIKDSTGGDAGLIHCKDNNYPSETFEEEVREFQEDGNTDIDDLVAWLNSKHSLSTRTNPVFERVFVTEIYP